ncbi:MAG: hypothetical protein ACREBU_24105 [Nitrososphaera sp.]
MDRKPHTGSSRRHISETPSVKTSRYDWDHANISIPEEMVEFINRWLASPKAKAAGIKSRRDLTMTLFEITLQKIAKMAPKLKATGPWHYRNDTIPRSLFQSVAESVGTREADPIYVAKALWIPQSTSMLAFALHNFLIEQDNSYAELIGSLRVTFDDIQRFKNRATEK